MLETKEECDIMKIKREIILFGFILTVFLISSISQGVAQSSAVPFKQGDSYTFSVNGSSHTTAKDSNGNTIYKTSQSLSGTITHKIVEVNTSMNYLNVSYYSTYDHKQYYSKYYYNGTQDFYDSFGDIVTPDYTTNYGKIVLIDIYSYSTLAYVYLNMTAIKKGFQNYFNTTNILYQYNSTYNATMGSLLASADSYKFMGQSTIVDGLAQINENTRTFSFEITFSNKMHFYSYDQSSNKGDYNKTYTKFTYHITATYDDNGVIKNTEYGYTAELSMNGFTETSDNTYKVNRGSSSSSAPGFEFIPLLTSLLAITVILRKSKKI